LAKKHQFVLSAKASGFGPSDHDSFCMKRIPVLFFWTGTHEEYHRPGDTPDRIDYTGMRRIVDASEELLNSFVKMEKPTFSEVKGGTPVRPSAGPRLAFRPKYDEDVVGIGVEGVTPGGPADRAGLKTGDVIVKVGGIEVKDFPTYFQAMALQKP